MIQFLIKSREEYAPHIAGDAIIGSSVRQKMIVEATVVIVSSRSLNADIRKKRIRTCLHESPVVRAGNPVSDVTTHDPASEDTTGHCSTSYALVCEQCCAWGDDYRVMGRRKRRWCDWESLVINHRLCILIILPLNSNLEYLIFKYFV